MYIKLPMDLILIRAVCNAFDAGRSITWESRRGLSLTEKESNQTFGGVPGSSSCAGVLAAQVQRQGALLPRLPLPSVRGRAQCPACTY
jgi:hypothetical protein